MTDGLIRLKVEDITIGVPLPWPIYDRNGTFLIKKNFVIQSESQVERLLAHGAYGLVAEMGLPVEKPTVVEVVSKPKDFSPFKILEDVTSRLAITLANNDNPDVNFTDEIMALVEDIQRACFRDASAALASLFVLDKGSYPIKHSVDVAVLSGLMAGKRGLEAESHASVIAAALTMNIAMIGLQEILFQQETPLTEEQKKQIFNHPTQSVAMLQQANVTDRLWLKCVLAHHEKVNGTGYPNKFAGSQYPVEAQLIALADQYCARMSPRAYRQPLLHKGILRDILLDDGQTVLPDIATLFIKELGFYPPGLIVQLISGEIGVVTKCGENADTPIVHVCYKPGKGDLRVPIQRNTSLGGNKVRKILLSDDPLVTFDRRSVWRFNEE
jgi:HD-GYP domain-containing protein (c-di-GMP phosphodiesterase class II)